MMRRRGILQSSRRRNPGHSPMRQRMAPQPDRAQPLGARPMDTMQRNLPNPQMLNPMAGMSNPQANPMVRKSGGQAGGQVVKANQPKQPTPMVPGYEQFLDSQTAKDRAMPKGLTDQQVMWMKRNLLGREGEVGGREGGRFQKLLSKYIANAGGPQAFAQMLEQMPGWNKRQVVAGGTDRMSANTFRPGEGPQRSVGKAGEVRKAEPIRAAAPVSAPVQQPQPVQRPQQQQSTAQPQPMQRSNAPQSQPAAQVQTAQPQRQQMATGQAHQRAAARAYGGEVDRGRQKQKDREFFGKRGVALTPELEEGMRQLTDQYLAALIDLGYAEADAAVMLAQEKERLATDYGSDQADLQEAQAEAGMFNSGQHIDSNRQLNTGYGRSFQDLATGAAQQQRGFADMRAQLLEALRSGRQELSLDATGQSVADAYAGGYNGLPKTKRRRSA